MRIDVVTIFPEYLAPASLSLLGKAQSAGLISVHVHDLREHATDRHNTVDDSPYGGGPGMVMKPEPWGEMLDDLVSSETVLVIPTPSGKPFTQKIAHDLAQASHIVFACGRYEGIDSRVAAHYATRIQVLELSLGDYVLAGGEVAVMVMIEAVARLIPGVLGNSQSVVDDSFAPGQMENLLEGPVFTRPPVWRDLDVPAILTSGDHAKIAAWRHDQAVARTQENRPDLLG